MILAVLLYLVTIGIVATLLYHELKSDPKIRFDDLKSFTVLIIWSSVWPVWFPLMLGYLIVELYRTRKKKTP